MSFTWDELKNWAVTSVTAPPEPAVNGTRLVVKNAGALPSTPPYNVTVAPSIEALIAAGEQVTAINAEELRVTSVNGNELAVERQQGASIARAIQAGDQIYQGDTKHLWEQVRTAIEANAAAISAETTRAEAAEAAAIAAAEAAAKAASEAEVKAEEERATGAEKKAQEEAEKASVPLTQKGANSGVMALTAGGIGAQPPAHHASTHAPGGSDELTVADLPVSVVSSRAPGLSPSTPLDTTPELFGAKGDGVTDDTFAAMRAAMAIGIAGGGRLRWSDKPYVIGKEAWLLLPGVKHEGQGAGATIWLPPGGSGAPQIVIPPSPIREIAVRGISMLPNGNAGQSSWVCKSAGGIYGGPGQLTANSNVVTGAEGWKAGDKVVAWGLPECEVLKVTGSGTNRTLELSGNAAATVSPEPVMLFKVEPVASGGGIWEAEFEEVHWGNVGETEAWQGTGSLFVGSITGALTPMQDLSFKSCRWYHANTGTHAKTSRPYVFMGQCEKVKIDGRCWVNGQSPAAKVGTGGEFSRYFGLVAPTTAEAAAGSEEITLESATGLEANKKVRLGEGAEAELLTVGEISGLKVKVTTALKFTHATGTNLYALGGTVAAPATIAPREIVVELGQNENHQLGNLLDAVRLLTYVNADFENSTRAYRAMAGCYRVGGQVNSNEAASEGENAGTGVATVGSATLTGCSFAWKVGDIVNARGIKAFKVEKVEGTTIELSHVVEANGTEGPQSLTLVKGGEGKGYVASYEESSYGELGYHTVGQVDQGIVCDATSTCLPRHPTRGEAVAQQTSSGVALAVATGSSVNVLNAPEVVFTDHVHAVQTLRGYHGTGDTITLRAGGSELLLENGGNLSIPGGKLKLAEGGAAVFKKTDHGPLTWALVGSPLLREPIYTTVEELNASLEEASGDAWPIQWDYNPYTGVVTFVGEANVKTEIAAAGLLFKLPSSARPTKTRRQRLIAASEAGKYLTIETTGEVKTQAALKASAKVDFSATSYVLLG